VKEHRAARITAPAPKVTRDVLKGPTAGFAEVIWRLKEDCIRHKSLKKTCLSRFPSPPCQGQGLWGGEVRIAQGHGAAHRTSATPPAALSAYRRASRRAHKRFHRHHRTSNSVVCDPPNPSHTEHAGHRRAFGPGWSSSPAYSLHLDRLHPGGVRPNSAGAQPARAFGSICR